MTSTERELRIKKLQETVHQKPDNSKYSDITLRECINCYAYAIGATEYFWELYRIGAICGKKEINQHYFSKEEIVYLLYQDLKVLNLKIEQCSENEKIADNQYKIALFIKIYADNEIHDFHFLRFDENVWSEKFRGRYPRILGNSLKNLYSDWPWNFVGIFKITM